MDEHALCLTARQVRVENSGLLAPGSYSISGTVCILLKDRHASAFPDKLVPMDML